MERLRRGPWVFILQTGAEVHSISRKGMDDKMLVKFALGRKFLTGRRKGHGLVSNLQHD